MINLERLDQFRRNSAAVSDVIALRALLAQEVVALGFDRFAYVALQQPKGVAGRLYFGTYPADWSQFYMERSLALHDPIMTQPFRAVQPFLWNHVAQSEGDRASEMLVFGPAADAGLRAGAAVPIHGPFGGVALLAVSKDCPEPQFVPLFEEQRYALQIIAYAAHDTVVRLTDALQLRPAVRFSPRQREVLLWVIHGKTNWEVGEILGIAEDTVRQHLRAICRLLGASNRAQAAAIAVNRRLILADASAAGTIRYT